MKKRAATWAQVKASLNTLDRAGLLGVIQNLYDASDINRRFLHARFVPAASTLEEYRRLVRMAVFPDPLSQRPVRLRDATATITAYKRATGDLAGTVDLMLEFVEAGTEQAADLGFGDDVYFAALERKVREVVQALDAVSEADRDGVFVDSWRSANTKRRSAGIMATSSRMLPRRCNVGAPVRRSVNTRSNLGFARQND